MSEQTKTKAGAIVARGETRTVRFLRAFGRTVMEVRDGDAFWHPAQGGGAELVLRGRMLEARNADRVCSLLAGVRSAWPEGAFDEVPGELALPLREPDAVDGALRRWRVSERLSVRVEGPDGVRFELDGALDGTLASVDLADAETWTLTCVFASAVAMHGWERHGR